MLTYDIIRNLPKVDLHCHLEGAIRPQTAYELFQKNHMLHLDTVFENFLPLIQTTGKEKDLFDFLNKIITVTRCLKYKNDLTRITYEAIEDAASDNIIYKELRFSPHFIYELTGIPLETIIESVLAGRIAGMENFQVQIELILIMPQYGGVEMGYETVALAKKYQQFGTTGIDVAGDIRELGLEVYTGVFDEAVDQGLGITIHAGEITPAETVRLAVERLHATRIGHGIRSVDDPEVMDMLRSRDVLLEICMISNLQTRAVGTINEHPLRTLHENGVKLSINTDDPGISNSLLSDEYLLLQNFDYCTRESLLQFNSNAINSAFTSTVQKMEINSTLTKDYHNGC